MKKHVLISEYKSEFFMEREVCLANVHKDVKVHTENQYAISIFYIRSFWLKNGALHLIELDFPSHKDPLCQLWLKLAKWFLRRLIFKC